MNQQQPERHMCHCGKGFLRKEHLRRHQATHSTPTFVCHICQRSFTRRDLLRRHLTLHDVVQAPDSRRVRACDACHVSKIRCDGGPRCSLCTKRGVDCSFNRGRPSNDHASVSGSSLHSIRDQSSSPNASTDSGDIPHGSIHPDLLPNVSLESTNHVLQSNGVLRGLHPEYMIRVARLGLQTILEAISGPRSNSSLKTQPQFSTEMKAWSRTCIATFFGRFHDRWPILHAPTFEQATETTYMRASVIIIGSWFYDDAVLKDLISEIHTRLVKQLLDELSGTTQERNRPWPVETYQAALLNVIFAFESGGDRNITKARLLHSLLVTAMREAKVFSSDAVEDQMTVHFPGDFPPWIFTMNERWKRLAIASFKIDTYLSLLSNQPPVVQREELDLSLPSTFSMWNSYGLDVFCRRYPVEPLDRSQYKICDLAIGSPQPMASGTLVEDVQVRLLGCTNSIWILRQMRRNQSHGVSVHSEQNDVMSGRLKRCKHQLDMLAGVWNDPDLHKQNIDFLLSAYSGEEEPSQLDWKEQVLARLCSSLFSAIMLYYLLSLHVYADVSMLTHEASDMELTMATPPAHRKQMKVKEWAFSTDSRAAVLQAILCWRAYEGAASRAELRGESVDPVAYMALSAGATVLWVWVMNYIEMCTCMSDPNRLDIGLVSLGAGRCPETEVWIQNGGNISLHGVSICRCNVDAWLTPMAAALTRAGRTWEMGNVVARRLWSRLGPPR